MARAGSKVSWWLSSLGYSVLYGAGVGALAGAVYQVVRFTSTIFLIQVGLIGGQGPLVRGSIAEEAPFMVTIALYGAAGGMFFGVIIGALVGLIASVMWRWHITPRRHFPRVLRIAVFTVAAVGWLWNAAISPRDSALALVVMAELGICVLDVN
jgi:hypothetical protein